MSVLQNRIRPKNEATGMRVVAQYVQEFWECGWQPFDARNDKGIDGLILMRQKSQDLGVKINVQVKCGAKYITSITEDEIRISFDDDKGLYMHLLYWRKQLEPTILVFVNPCKPKRNHNGEICRDDKSKIIWIESRLNAEAWWVDLKDPEIIPENNKTIIRIKKSNTFGEHSKGYFLKMVKSLSDNTNLPCIIPKKENSSLLYSTNLKKDARTFYVNWKKQQPIFCKALKQNIRVSKTGWRHILLSRRGNERRTISLRLLGIAKQAIEEIDNFYLLNQKETLHIVEQKLGIRAILKEKNQGNLTVQVIILRRLSKKTGNQIFWFYSVHYRR